MLLADTIRWGISRALATYIAKAPLSRGKGFVMRAVLRRILPPYPVTFRVRLDDGSLFDLYYREVIGMVFFIYGSFEAGEIRLLKELTRPRTTVFDVGANIGCLAIPVARFVKSARVIAIEALPQNVGRLRAHAALNSVENIEVIEAAATDLEGTIAFSTNVDPALGSVSDAHTNALVVASTTIDAIWTRAGCPDVSIIKIDVEGTEVAVLRGARAVLRQCRPLLLVEANTSAALMLLRDELTPLGYSTKSVRGPQPWNYLFGPN